jgi:toxin ParE1/3/4
LKITFSPEARPEFADAVRWYAIEAGPQRAADFRNAVHRTLALLAEHPSMGAPAASNTRRIVVHHYPYSIFYRASADTLRVLAVVHQSRRPDYWVGRR